MLADRKESVKNNTVLWYAHYPLFGTKYNDNISVYQPLLNEKRTL